MAALITTMEICALVELGNMEFSMNDSTPMAANLENLELIIDGEKSAIM